MDVSLPLMVVALALLAGAAVVVLCINMIDWWEAAPARSAVHRHRAATPPVA